MTHGATPSALSSQGPDDDWRADRQSDRQTDRPAVDPVLSQSGPQGRGGRAGDEAEALERWARSEKPADRRRAVRAFAARGTLEGWKRVIGLLADPESEVGDEAELALGRIDDPQFAAELAGRAGLSSREDAVRRRAAEALGRVATTARAEPLAAALDDADREVAHLAAWSLERLAHGRRLSGDLSRSAEQCEHAARASRDGLVRASALAARAALETLLPAEDERRRAAFALAVRRGSEDRDPRVRCAALIASRRLERALALHQAEELALDESSAVRLARVGLLEELACRPAAGALIESLPPETHPRVRAAIVAALQRLSGFRHREDPRPWRDWLRDLPADWRPTLGPGPEESRGAEAAAGGEARTIARTNFVGLPLYSRRVCFAIDFSGSMWTPMPDGRMPKELVDARLRSTLESLPAETQFNVVPFTNEVLPWRPKLVPATPGNVRAAIADFERCQARGRGNFYDAAVFALEDPEVDTLVTLSDGVPTGGFHSDLDLVVPLLVARNRFRGVAFDTVLVDPPQAAVRRWQVLSSSSGGRLVTVEKAE